MLKKYSPDAVEILLTLLDRNNNKQEVVDRDKISQTMYWSNTYEGHNFWSDINKVLGDNDKLTKKYPKLYKYLTSKLSKTYTLEILGRLNANGASDERNIACSLDWSESNEGFTYWEKLDSTMED